MSESEQKSVIKVNTGKLCREETYTDTEVCYFRQLVPIHLDGTPDLDRKPIFMGMTHVVTEAGPVPVQAPLVATTLEEAILEFPEAAKKALDELIRQAKEAQAAQVQRNRPPQQAEPSKIFRP